MSKTPSGDRNGVHEKSTEPGPAAGDTCPPSIPNELAGELVLHVGRLVRLCCQSFPEHDRMDMAQDALVELVVRAHEGRPVQEPRSWLVAVIHNIRRMRCPARSRDRGALSLSSWPPDSQPESPHEPACRADPWAELEPLLDDVLPPYSEEDKADLRAFAAGDTRHEIARARCEKVRVVGQHGALPPVLRRDLDAVHVLGRSPEGCAL